VIPTLMKTIFNNSRRMRTPEVLQAAHGHTVVRAGPLLRRSGALAVEQRFDRDARATHHDHAARHCAYTTPGAEQWLDMPPLREAGHRLPCWACPTPGHHLDHPFVGHTPVRGLFPASQTTIEIEGLRESGIDARQQRTPAG
jgi:hypothetical protein